MKKEQRYGGREPPRVYDRISGEYRPVPAGSERGFRQGAAMRALRRKRRRRRALLLFYVFLFLSIVSAAAVLSLTVLFKIDAVRVTGTSRYSQNEIVAASGIAKGENLFLVKTGAAADRIRKKLPYIGTVKISRKLPAAVEINVSEDTICGAIPYGGKYAVVGSGEKLLEITDKLPEGCALIKGLELRGAQTGEQMKPKDSSREGIFRDLTKALQNNKMTDISQMDFTSEYRIEIVYENRITINLGLPSDFDCKIRYARKLFDTGNIKKTERGLLNLSVVPDNKTAYFDPNYKSPSGSRAPERK